MANKKRSHGDGTIYERKTKGDFCAQITLPDGKRKTVGYAKTRRDAQQKLREAQLLLQQGKLTTRSTTVTVGQHLAHWLEHVAKPSVSYHTYEAYEGAVRRRLTPGIGSVRLVDLRPRHIQELYTDLGKTLAPKTIRLTHVALHQALELAVEWDMIATNTAKKVKLPKLRTKDKHVLAPEQVAHLLASTRDHRLGPVWHLLVTTGARKGELLGLKWSDVDWDEGTLRIERQLTRQTGKGLVFTAPKSEKSRRTIPLGPGTLAILRDQQRRQEEDRERATWWEDRPEYRDLIFTTQQGRPLDPATVWRDFQITLERCDLSKMTVHELRDTAATTMLNGGIDAKTISERLGHSDVALTLRVYSHVRPAMHKEAATRLEELYQAAGGQS